MKAVQLRLLDVPKLTKKQAIEFDKALFEAARDLASHAQSFVNAPTPEKSKALHLRRRIFGLVI